MKGVSGLRRDAERDVDGRVLGHVGFPTCDDAIMNKTNVPVHAKDGEVWEGVAQKNVF